ncbi:MAG: DUF1829 domain-containing protein [Bacillota bacterium]
MEASRHDGSVHRGKPLPRRCAGVLLEARDQACGSGPPPRQERLFPPIQLRDSRLETAAGRVVEPINIPDRNRIEPLLFSWSDTRETRHPDTVLYALLNDTERRVSPAVLSALAQ